MKISQYNSEFVILNENVVIINSLPVAHYDICFGAFGRIYLQKKEAPQIPEKIYSNDQEFIEHALKTCESSEGNIGIALFGKKGLGKSFTANIIASKLDLPVIHLTDSTNNPGLISFLNDIKQDFVLQIDEFEKKFDRHKYENENNDDINQENFLTFLDGGTVRKNKIVFLITGNNINELNEFMKNRPSRLRYLKNYDKLSFKVIEEIVDDLLVNQNYKKDLIENLSTRELNIDVLIQIINEINIHDKPYSSFCDFFNYKDLNKDEYDAYIVRENDSKEKLIDGDIIQSHMLREDYYVGKDPKTLEYIFTKRNVLFTNSPREVETICKQLNPDKNSNKNPKEVKIVFVKRDYSLMNAYSSGSHFIF